MSRDGCLKGSGRSSTAFTTPKMAVFAPMPNARVRTATPVKPRFLRSMRAAKRKSCHNVSTKDSQPSERTTSFVTSTFPCSKRTARSASLRLIPCFTFSSTAISKKPRSSSSNSPSTRSFRNSDRNPGNRLVSSDMGSLESQGHYRVDARRAARGDVTGCNRDNRQHKCHRREGERVK